ncbi:DUF3830 family protein [Mesorhizobium sp. M0659]|uniref:DUF3830 family protein n=1 Tax=Mesorhizobium sp. M0659 TaxID=2956980 RepID=UPI003337D543
MHKQTIRISESHSGLDVAVELLGDKAPGNVAFLWDYLREPRSIPSIHAIWTGPEISCPIPMAHLIPGGADPLPLENAALTPQPGDLVLSYVPARVWGGGPDPIFDIGFFYGPGGRLFFPIGWLPGSVVGRVPATQIEALAAACGKIRRSGACDIKMSRVEA